MIGAVEVDPNAMVAAIVTVVVSVVGLYGVMLQQGRRLKIVTEQVAPANGGTLGSDVYATKQQLQRLAEDSRERWDVTVAVQETVAKIHHNQVEALRNASDLLREMAALRQAQTATDQRLGQLENHTTRELSEVRALVDLLQKRVDSLTSTPPQLTPPYGTPAV
jgi:hypothetical protein